ncbi:MAG: hypothetical protein QX199_10670 [Methylococcaceae bacterium]
MNAISALAALSNSEKNSSNLASGATCVNGWFNALIKISHVYGHTAHI